MTLPSHLHTLTGILLVACFAIKVSLHAYLDSLNGKIKPYQAILFFPLTFLGPYSKEVKPEISKLKLACNLLFYLGIFFILMNLVLGLAELAIY
jgi:hypothetical protein